MKKRAVLMCILLVTSMMLTTAAVTAKKPDKPPGGGGGGGGDDPTGTVFFQMADENGDVCVWTVSPDGSGKTKQALIVDYSQSLSWEKHDGDYWYVHLRAITGDTYPDGQDRYEIYAFRDDNTGGLYLTDDETMAFSLANWGGSPKWVPGDEYLSWAGKEWVDNGDGTYTEKNYGIYRAAIQYDTDGAVTGLGTPRLVYDTGSFYDEYYDSYYPSITAYDWNPAGTKIVYNDGVYVYIGSISNGGSPTQLVEGGWPRWSPDGTKIMFGRVKEVLVIDIDGTNMVSLVKVKTTKGSFHDIFNYIWSPDGKDILYTHHIRNRHTWAQKTYMYTMGCDGSGNSLISGFDASVWKVNRDWR